MGGREKGRDGRGRGSRKLRTLEGWKSKADQKTGAGTGTAWQYKKGRMYRESMEVLKEGPGQRQKDMTGRENKGPATVRSTKLAQVRNTRELSNSKHQ
jgi:hypothetical protein